MLNRTRRTSREVASELRESKQRAKELQERIAQIEEELKTAQAELKELVGGPFIRSNGKIGDLTTELKAAKLYEDDQKQPKIVWAVKPQWDTDEKIVRKITKKRIYVAKPGCEYCEWYSVETGEAVSKHERSKIDLKATFGEDYAKILRR